MSGFEPPVPLSRRNPAATAATALTAAQATAATGATADATGVAPAAPHTGIAESTARLPPSPQAGFDLPVYAVAAARTQAARSEGEDNATYRGRFFRSPNSEVGDLLDTEAKRSSRSRVPDSDGDSDVNDEEPNDKEPDAEEPDDEEPESADPRWLLVITRKWRTATKRRTITSFCRAAS